MNNGDKSRSELLFFKVWRNKFLKTHILNFTKSLFTCSKQTISQLENSNNINYIEKVRIAPRDNNDKTPLDITIPDNIEYIKFNENVIIEPNAFSMKSKIKSINFGKQVKEVNIKNLPITLVKLSFSIKTKLIIPHDTPYFNNLQFINIAKPSQHILDHDNIKKFNNLHTLSISEYNHPIINIPIITKLIFTEKFNQPLPKLPNSIKSIIFGSALKRRINLLTLPENLEVLYFSNSYNKFNIHKFKRFKNLRFLYFFSNKNQFLNNLQFSKKEIILNFPFIKSITCNKIKIYNNLIN